MPRFSRREPLAPTLAIRGIRGPAGIRTPRPRAERTRIAAFRYMVMGWWGQRPATAAEREEREQRRAVARAGVPRELRDLPQNRRHYDAAL